MNDQQHSSADALTDAQRRTLQSALDLFVAMGHSPDSDHVRTLSAMLAAYRVQQPAAAPIDECELCHSSGYMDETLGGALPGVPDAPCMNGCKATEQTAPSPADERTAFEKVFPMPADCQRIGSGPTAGYAPTEYGAWEAHDFIRRWEGWKARAAASPAAHVAPFLLDSQQPAQADTIQCQAHSGPDCTECGGTGIWPAQADALAEARPVIPSASHGVWPTDAMNQAGLRALAEFHHTRGDAVDAVFLAMCAAARAQGGES